MNQLNHINDENITGKPVIEVNIEGSVTKSEGVNLFATLSNKSTSAISQRALLYCGLSNKIMHRIVAWEEDDDDWPIRNGERPLGRIDSLEIKFRAGGYQRTMLVDILVYRDLGPDIEMKIGMRLQAKLGLKTSFVQGRINVNMS